MALPTGRLNIRLNTTSLVLLNRRFTAWTQLDQCKKETTATILVTNGQDVRKKLHRCSTGWKSTPGHTRQRKRFTTDLLSGSNSFFSTLGGSRSLYSSDLRYLRSPGKRAAQRGDGRCK